MKYAVLDTNFILSCVRKKIDFFEKIKFMGFKILIPMQVIAELEKISKKGNIKFSIESKLALTIIKKNIFTRIDLKMKNVDNGIVSLADRNKEYIVATLDRAIKNKLKNQKIVIRGQKNLEIVS
jgi:rRNA-processing protein FCF1